MYLVDTSIWIDHFRKSSLTLVELLAFGFVSTHEFVILELASGSIPKREQTLKDLKRLPTVDILDTDTILDFISRNSLYSKGLSMIDIHLLASALVNDLQLLTKDKKLNYYYKNLR